MKHIEEDDVKALAQILPFEIAKLELGPNDVLVLRTDRQISSEIADRLREYIERQLNGRKAIVLGPGCTFEKVAVA